jgi:hypothetical protein
MTQRSSRLRKNVPTIGAAFISDILYPLSLRCLRTIADGVKVPAAPKGKASFDLAAGAELLNPADWGNLPPAVRKHHLAQTVPALIACLRHPKPPLIQFIPAIRRAMEAGSTASSQIASTVRSSKRA